MWTKSTAENLRSRLEYLHERISDCYASGNMRMYCEYAIDVRRIELALSRLTIGRVR